jgi:CYTH domain-containing protein
MGVETEKKFLLSYFPDDILTKGTFIRQGYLIKNKSMVLRIRLAGDKAFLTIKGPTYNASRKEFEYEIPADEADEMLCLFCRGPLIEKTRFKIQFRGFEWVIDKFSGENQGLVVAEIELDCRDQVFEKPDWIGKEVTDDPRYFNSNLVQNPYSSWNHK